MDASSDMVITTRRNILPVISVCVTTVNPTDVSSCNVPNPVVNRTNVSLERVANISVQKVCVFSFSYFLFWQALKKKKFPNIKKIIQIVMMHRGRLASVQFVEACLDVLMYIISLSISSFIVTVMLSSLELTVFKSFIFQNSC